MSIHSLYLKLLFFSSSLLILIFVLENKNLHDQTRTHYIKCSDNYVDAIAMNINPGDTICLEAGERIFLKLMNFQGSKEKPLIITNCGGQVVFHNTAHYYTFNIDNSRFFKLTGTGDPSFQYGIKIDSTPPLINGLVIENLSSDYEVEFIEVTKAGFAGIMAKTDPRCDARFNRGAFIQQNTSIHHNYVHDVKGEGLYIGNSFFTGKPDKCQERDTILYPHHIIGLEVYENIVENVGWDGIQIGCAIKDVKIHHNIIKNYGLENSYSQQSGFQINPGTSGKLYNNQIINGSGTGILVLGYGDNLIYNNLIVNTGGDGIFCDDRVTRQGAGFHFVNNTIINTEKHGFKIYSKKSVKNLFINNIIAGSKAPPLQVSDSVDILVSNNLINLPLESLGFEDPLNLNFRLAPGSAAIGKGLNVHRLGITHDLDNNLRNVEMLFDIGAFQSNF